MQQLSTRQQVSAASTLLSFSFAYYRPLVIGVVSQSSHIEDRCARKGNLCISAGSKRDFVVRKAWSVELHAGMKDSNQICERSWI